VEGRESGGESERREEEGEREEEEWKREGEFDPASALTYLLQWKLDP